MSQENPYITKTEHGYVITEEGIRHLQEILTSTDGLVYAFNENAPPLLVSAAMARLSRRGDDLRVTYLDEFAHVAPEKAGGLFDRVITAYGDDSVQQLVGLHFVVEGASNILTKLIEWGRLASYLEQSTRYIYFDKRNENGSYKYYTPPNLGPKIEKHYRAEMDNVFEMYSKAVRKLASYIRNKHPKDEKTSKSAWISATRAEACDAARILLPAATTSTVGVFASAQAVEMMIMRLLAEDLVEARTCGEQILSEARKVIPAFLKRADLPDRGGAITAYRANTRHAIAKIAQQFITDSDSFYGMRGIDWPGSVDLLTYTPENELDLVSDILFAHTDHSTHEIQKKIARLSDSEKEAIFFAYIGERLNRRHRPGRALERAHYQWEVLGDYGSFRDIQRHRMVDEFEWQLLTPMHGYSIPALAQEAGLADLFHACFAKSEALYRTLRGAGFDQEAQYATLFGHLMRYRYMENAREAFHIHELRTTSHCHPSYRRIVLREHELLCEVHPRIGSAMCFVNKDENEELTRLAAERATEHKLALLRKKVVDNVKNR